MIKIKFLFNHKISGIFKDEEGFTTLSVVVSLLVTLSLIFSTAQVYRINSAAADIQSVADSSVQAAENEVAEFMILVRVSDSVILSLGLGSLVATGLGVVAMCTPVTAAASEVLLECAQKMLQARDNFANTSASALNQMQKALPFLSSIKAYEAAVANNGGTFNANYMAISILMPGEGVTIEPGNINDVKNLWNDVNNSSSDIKQAAAEAEEAAKAANNAKLRAFMADCGNNPNYCMYERALNKAYMTGPENPLYNSVDAWSFSVALNRCKYYYPKRLQIEKPDGSSVNAQANSALRRVFYSYASNQMNSAYVIESGDYFNAYFPHLPKNTDEMRQTEMYTNVWFPISDDGCMHAYSNCPGCLTLSNWGTIQQMEAWSLPICPYCEFRASSLGSVASASSSINNGYEYHYSIVENAAKEYQAAREAAAPLNQKVKGFAEGIFQKIKDIASQLVNKRIYAKPPGSYGTIALVVNTSSAPASRGFESSFVSSNSNLGIRAATSASTLIEEKSDEGKTVLNSILDGLVNDIPGVAGAAGIALNLWSKLLEIYSNGQTGFINALESCLNQLPVISASGLGTWASKRISEILQTLGLEPANLNALKPVLINSYYVANAEQNEEAKTSVGNASKTFAVNYLSIRNSAINFSESTNTILSSISNGKELAKALNLDEVIYSGGSIEIAVIQPLGNLGPSIPITIKLPKFATGTMDNIVSWIANTLQSILGNLWGGKVWR